ncbi:MAG TPA: hypothetical protein G4O08_03305 [Anaerolineae bacterium]|nr:hypothetical protein [Anaerolineae bacterium]
MTRSIILAAPARQLSKLLTCAERKTIYDAEHPVWEDVDRRRAFAGRSEESLKKERQASK